MKKYALICLLVACVSLSARANETEIEGPHVRILRGDDGSKTIFKRLPNQNAMIKSTYDPNGVLTSQAHYRNVKNTNLLGSCKIYDAQNKEIFKVSYAYDKFGRLTQERMYDSASNKLARIFLYSYDEQGNRLKPRAITYTNEGLQVKDRFRFSEPSAPQQNLFGDEPKTTNPNAKPIKNNTLR